MFSTMTGATRASVPLHTALAEPIATFNVLRCRLEKVGEKVSSSSSAQLSGESSRRCTSPSLHRKLSATAQLLSHSELLTARAVDDEDHCNPPARQLTPQPPTPLCCRATYSPTASLLSHWEDHLVPTPRPERPSCRRSSFGVVEVRRRSGWVVLSDQTRSWAGMRELGAAGSLA